MLMSGIKPPPQGREASDAAAAAAAGGGGAAAHQDATGVRAPLTPAPPPGAAVAKAPRRLPDPDAAAAADAAKEAVMRLVGEREAAIGALRSLMPAPRGVVARGARTASSSTRPSASRRRAPTSPSSSPRYAARAPPSAAPSLSGS